MSNGIKVGDAVRLKAGATAHLKDERGYWLDAWPESIDGLAGVVSGDYGHNGEYPHWGVKLAGLEGVEVGISGDYLEAQGMRAWRCKGRWSNKKTGVTYELEFVVVALGDDDPVEAVKALYDMGGMEYLGGKAERQEIPFAFFLRQRAIGGRVAPV